MLLEAVRSELEPIADHFEDLQLTVDLLVRRSVSDRRERIEDLELLVQLVIEGWRTMDRRLGRLEKTIARIDEGLRTGETNRRPRRVNRADPSVTPRD